MGIWPVMARVPAAPPCQPWPEFPRQFLAHGLATPVLLLLPYGKLPTVLQHRIYRASEVFTAPPAALLSDLFYDGVLANDLRSFYVRCRNLNQSLVLHWLLGSS